MHERPLIVPERLQPRNSKAFDWALTCVKQKGELRAIRLEPAQHSINQRRRTRQNCL